MCLGFEPGVGRMVGTDETTELWRPPYYASYLPPFSICNLQINQNRN